MPFAFATALGLGCAALAGTKYLPHGLSAAQFGAGLTAPATAITLLEAGGVGLLLLLLSMSVTSAPSAEADCRLLVDHFRHLQNLRQPSCNFETVGAGIALRHHHLLTLLGGVLQSCYCATYQEATPYEHVFQFKAT